MLLTLALGLMIFAFISRQNAITAEASARSKALAQAAISQIGRDPQRALLLARAALQSAPAPEAELAAREALDANTARADMPSLGYQLCVTGGQMRLVDRARVAAVTTCSGDIVLEDLAHRRILRRIHVGGHLRSLTLGPAPGTLIGSTDQDLIRIDIHSGAIKRIFTFPSRIGSPVFSPSGRILAVNMPETAEVVILDLHSRRLRVIARGDLNTNPLTVNAWASPHRLLVATEGLTRGTGTLGAGLNVIDLRRGTIRLVPLADGVHRASLSQVKVSPNRRTWYVTGADFNTVTGAQVAATWAVDARSRHVRWVARGPLNTYACPLAPSPDGRLLAVGYCQGTSDVLDAATGELVVRDAGANSTVKSVVFASDSRSLVTSSLDGVVRVWAAHGAQRLRVQLPNDPAVGFSAGGRNVVAVGDRGEILDGGTGQPLRSFPGFPAASLLPFSASPQFARFTYVDPTSAKPRIREIDGRTGRLLATITAPRLQTQAVAPDGRIVVGYSEPGRLLTQLVDPRTGRRRNLQPGVAGHSSASILQPSFTTDGRLMATGDAFNYVDVWNLGSGRLLRTIVLPDRESGASPVFSPNGRSLVVTVLGGTFIRVDLATGKLREVPGGDTEGQAIAASPNGRFYALGRGDGTVDVYDSSTLRVIRHHTLNSAILTLAFSPDSRQLAIEDTRHVLEVWDTCAICENAQALAQAAASVRAFTPGERATFGVS